MNILAIDPGYDRCGVAVITKEDAKPVVLFSTCLTTKKDKDHYLRLASIVTQIERLLETYHPTHVALETLFFSVNKKTALMVAEIRGALLALVGLKRLELVELSPQAIKLALTGIGNASKEQVQKMVRLTVSLPKQKMIDDEVDAVALGIASMQHIHVERMKKGLQRK